MKSLFIHTLILIGLITAQIQATPTKAKKQTVPNQLLRIAHNLMMGPYTTPEYLPALKEIVNEWMAMPLQANETAGTRLIGMSEALFARVYGYVPEPSENITYRLILKSPISGDIKVHKNGTFEMDKTSEMFFERALKIVLKNTEERIQDLKTLPLTNFQKEYLDRLEKEFQTILENSPLSGPNTLNTEFYIRLRVLKGLASIEKTIR